MRLKKPNQELRRDLKKISSNLEPAAINILRLATPASAENALTILRLVNLLFEDASRLATCADEVKAGRIVRGKAE